MLPIRCIPVVIILAVAGACVRPGAPLADGAGDDDAAVDAIFAAWDRPGSPGCALAVAQDGELVYSRGYGYANLDHDIPITSHTVFDVASITKQFVGAILNMLALEGKLSLDDDIRQWLPELPEYEWPITLRHMLHHTSGLRDYLNLFPLAGRDDYHPISHAQILAMMSRQRALVFPPGDRYLYSNTAYMLLAQVAERAGGRSLGEMAEERIFVPLGMAGSLMYEDRAEIIPSRATGYDRDADGRQRIVHNYNFDVVGDGQLYSTVEDLLRWDQYLHGDEKPAIYSSMLTEGLLNNGEPTGYAHGIVLDQYRGLRTVGHSGSSWGFRSQLLRFVEPELSIAIACNSGSAEPGDLARRLADYYLADRLGPEGAEQKAEAGVQDGTAQTETLALTSDQLAKFAGEFFAAELDATWRFALVDGGLAVRIEQEPAIQAVPVANDRFVFRFEPAGWPEPQWVSLQFDRDTAGAVTSFALDSGSEQGILFERR